MNSDIILLKIIIIEKFNLTKSNTKYQKNYLFK